MIASGADALISDLEDFTPPVRRSEARSALAAFVRDGRERGCVARYGSTCWRPSMIDLEACRCHRRRL
jgi:citrate lyase beta subunit